MRRLAPILVIAVLALAGCGDSAEETTAPPPVDGGVITAKELREDWEGSPDCKRPRGASRWGCSVGQFRCQGVVSDRGWTISCSKPNQSVAFRVQPN